MIFKRGIVCAVLAVAGVAVIRPAAAGDARPLTFAPAHHAIPGNQGPFPTWNYQYAYGNTLWEQTILGHAPQNDNSVTVPVALVPVETGFAANGRTYHYSPSIVLPDGKTVLQHVLASPLFQNATFQIGGQSVGPTQYLDAYAKANVWNLGGQLEGYHVLLGEPDVSPVQKLRIAPKQGAVGTALGAKNAIVANIYYLDSRIQALLGSLALPPGAIPLFVTVQTFGYVPGVGCCVAFYANVTPTNQPYAVATYELTPGGYSEDVSGIVSVLANIVTNPYFTSETPCGLYEAAGPFAGGADYGTFKFALNGFKYHLPELALLPFFLDGSGATIDGLDGIPDVTAEVCTP
jgi:hypothetical protein